ncbi:MAG: hypothetical protein V1709_07840 [Planctomycetota bacterium]
MELQEIITFPPSRRLWRASSLAGRNSFGMAQGCLRHQGETPLRRAEGLSSETPLPRFIHKCLAALAVCCGGITSRNPAHKLCAG